MAVVLSVSLSDFFGPNPAILAGSIQRGNKRQACFFADEDYRCYKNWLYKYADLTGCRVHAYVLMTNPVHLLEATESPGAAGALMKALGQRYVQYVNRVYRRTGALWEGRYRSCLVQEAYLFACLPALN